MLGRLIRRRMSNFKNVSTPKYAVGTQPYTVLVEGNIASGKTSFLQNFEHLKDDICILTEPVEKWRNVGDTNLLSKLPCRKAGGTLKPLGDLNSLVMELMYTDPSRWALPFQTYVTLTMLKGHTAQTDKRIKLMERSIFSSRYCFVENMYKKGTIEKGMYQVLQEWFKFIDGAIHIQADLIVYLRTTPEVVFERMRKRARLEENCVPLEYLRDLHELHENWLIRRKVGDNTKVLVLDATMSLDRIATEYKRFENVIKPMHKDEPTKNPDKVEISNTA